MVLVLKKYGGLGLETQSLGLGLDKKVLFTSLACYHDNSKLRALNLTKLGL